MFSGSMVALVTPFQDGKVDYKTLEEIVQFHLDSGTDGLVPVGTTGECPTLSHSEHKKVVERVVKVAGGKIPVIAGAGSNSTAEAIELTAFAKKIGADATLQVGPYYNKPTQEGFYQHFKAIADEVDLPIVLYNIPGRCGGSGMTPETVARLSAIENIVAIKEATGSLDQASEIASRCDITILSGDDSLTLPLASVGGKGVISVVANIVPADVKAMTDLILEGDFVSAQAAMSMLNMDSEELRLPMTPLEQSERAVLKKTLADYGLLG